MFPSRCVESLRQRVSPATFANEKGLFENLRMLGAPWTPYGSTLGLIFFDEECIRKIRRVASVSQRIAAKLVTTCFNVFHTLAKTAS